MRYTIAIDPALFTLATGLSSLKDGDMITFEGDPNTYILLSNPLHRQTGIIGALVDELTEPVKPSRKRRALLAQLERAKIRRDKNAIRDLTRQLEKVW